MHDDGVVSGSLPEFVALWFGSSNEGLEPRAMVEPLLSFNAVPSEPWRDGDVEVLVVENQGVWLWGRRPDGRFVERENEPDAPWREIEEDDEAFWLHHAGFEAVWALPAHRSAQEFGKDAVRRLEELTSPLPCAEWSWPGTRQRIRMRDRTVLMICAVRQAHWVVAAAPSEADLGWLDALDLRWDEQDSRVPTRNGG